MFLTCTVPVVEVEGSGSMLPRLKSINQYDRLISNSRIDFFKKMNLKLCYITNPTKTLNGFICMDRKNETNLMQQNVRRFADKPRNSQKITHKN